MRAIARVPFVLPKRGSCFEKGLKKFHSRKSAKYAMKFPPATVRNLMTF